MIITSIHIYFKLVNHFQRGEKFLKDYTGILGNSGLSEKRMWGWDKSRMRPITRLMKLVEKEKNTEKVVVKREEGE